MQNAGPSNITLGVLSLQNPDIVLVHYLNVPAIEDCGKPCGPILCSINTDKKEWAKWTKEELIGQLKPMCEYLELVLLLCCIYRVKCPSQPTTISSHLSIKLILHLHNIKLSFQCTTLLGYAWYESCPDCPQRGLLCTLGKIVAVFLHVLGLFVGTCIPPRALHVWVVIVRSQWVAVVYRWPYGTQCFELSKISYSFELCSLRKLLRCAE